MFGCTQRLHTIAVCKRCTRRLYMEAAYRVGIWKLYIQDVSGDCYGICNKGCIRAYMKARYMAAAVYPAG
jgi:predicted metal-binding protein